MKHSLFISAVAISLIVFSCSNKPDTNKTVVKGNFTIADSLDNSSDYSGTGVVLISRDTAEIDTDTLGYFTTDKSGNFEGTVQFPEKNFYRLIINRNGEDLGFTSAILSDGDTLNIQGEIPNLEETLTMTSREHDAMEVFNRVERNFQRVAAFVRGGAVADSMLADELEKWSNIYWEVHEDNPNTVASDYAAEQTVRLLYGFDNEKMLTRIDEALPAERMVSVALNFGVPYIAKQKGILAASSYLDSLYQLTDNTSLKELIARGKIKMHFDSSRVKEAKLLLTTYEDEYAEESNAQQWAKKIRYDLNYLAPGVDAPEFSFVTTAGDSVSNQLLRGDVYILEISPLANKEYQADLDRTIVLHEIYKNYGLKIFTIPLDPSEITVNAFFEERRQLWPVAQIGSFDVQQVVEKFNVTQVPTRLLIDKNGVLIRKYERGEFQEVIQGLSQAFRNNNPS